MPDDDLQRFAEEFLERVFAPQPEYPVVCESDQPPFSALQSWRKDAERLSFDANEVHLIFDGAKFGIQIPRDLLQQSFDEVF